MGNKEQCTYWDCSIGHAIADAAWPVSNNSVQSGTTQTPQVPPSTSVLPQGGSGNGPFVKLVRQRDGQWIEINPDSLKCRGDFITTRRPKVWFSSGWKTLDQAINYYQSFGFMRVNPNDFQGCCNPTQPPYLYVDQVKHTIHCPVAENHYNKFWREDAQQQLRPNVCDHEFVNYQGLNEAFEYCKKCDVKRT